MGLEQHAPIKSPNEIDAPAIQAPAGGDDKSKGRHHGQENVESATASRPHQHDHWRTFSLAK
jgi:hypothetical protein